MKILQGITRFGKRSLWFVCFVALVILTACGSQNTEGDSLDSSNNDVEIVETSLTDSELDSDSDSGSADDVLKFEKVVSSWEEFFATDQPLISAIPEKNIYLYGLVHDEYPDGVVLYWDEDVYDFDWLYITPRFILPRMQLSDFNADGVEELAIILYVNSGTEISIEELHILKKENGQVDDYVFDYDDSISQLENAVDFKAINKDEELLGEITIGNSVYTVNIEKYLPNEYGRVADEIIIGNIVHFSIEDHQLKAEFGVRIFVENLMPPITIGKLYADVEYRLGEFKLENIWFEQL